VTAPPPDVIAARARAEEVFSAAAVRAAVDRTAVAATLMLAEENPLVLCVLHGAIPFTGALMQRLQFPLELGCVHVERYGGGTTGGDLTWYARPRMPLAGRHVVLVDDILDQGVTLAALKRWAVDEGAAAVTVIVLVDKHIAARETRPVQAELAALESEDRYLFGWGMDYRGYWRNLPAIYALPAAREGAEGAETGDVA